MFDEPEYYKLIENFDQELMELFENTFNNKNKGFYSPRNYRIF